MFLCNVEGNTIKFWLVLRECIFAHLSVEGWKTIRRRTCSQVSLMGVERGGGWWLGRREEDWMILGHIASRPWVSSTVEYGWIVAKSIKTLNSSPIYPSTAQIKSLTTVVLLYARSDPTISKRRAPNHSWRNTISIFVVFRIVWFTILFHMITLKVAGNGFQYFLSHYNQSVTVDAKIMVSKNCPIIGE